MLPGGFFFKTCYNVFMTIRLPDNFLWGASLSAYQSEGGNFTCDWYEWEKKRKLTLCGDAARHYQMYKDDFKLASGLSLNSLRISLEWSRLYPDCNEFSLKELDHYRNVLDSLLKLHITPMVTLHHFTNPLWFMRKGGWRKSSNVDYFLDYVRTVVKALKDYCSFWLVFNEPMVYVYNGYISGHWPPGSRSLRDVYAVMENITKAYIEAYDEIKLIYRLGTLPAPQISIAKHMRDFAPCEQGGPAAKFFAKFRDRNFNMAFIGPLSRLGKLDFIGLNYYCRDYVKGGSLLGSSCLVDHHINRRNALGWHMSPEGMYDLLLRCGIFGLPVVITENGTAEKFNDHYEYFLLSHLKAMARAREKGVDIRGYFWWSLIDNFEWDLGFEPRFGLYEVDYKSYARKVRPFAVTYARICKANEIEI